MSLGLDIGSKTIKVVELAREGEKFILKAAGVVGYSGVDLPEIQGDKEMVALSIVIKKLVKDAKVTAKDVVIGLPEPQVFTRVIKFPMLTDQEIISAVKWEAEQYVPIPINEAIVQHQVIERRENATPPEVLVLLVAAPRALVEKYVKVVSLSGLNSVAVETELTALARSLGTPGKTSVILDFGARSSDIAIVKDSSVLFSRSIPTAGEAFTRAVAQSLGVSPAQAEEYKRTYGMTPGQLEGKVGAAIEPVLRTIAEEIKKAIHYYLSEEKGESPVSLVLAGGTAGMPEAASYLTKSLGLEVVMGNPFQKVVTKPEEMKRLAPFAPLYSSALGLAMRNDKN